MNSRARGRSMAATGPGPNRRGVRQAVETTTVLAALSWMHCR